MEKKTNFTTAVFLVEKDDNRNITRVCLGMKKRGYATGKWNGLGGKVGDKREENIRQAASRELMEEIKVEVLPEDLEKVAELSFLFQDNPRLNHLLSVFIVDEWEGNPEESDEMRPEWFDIENIPYDKMWSDDKLWLPLIIEGRLVKADFVFSKEGDMLIDNSIEIVDYIEENSDIIKWN
jgi:ADP-ribose pyrophosphatase YjhB (NUDIX family)